MSQVDLDNEISKWKARQAEILPDAVRLRMDQTYASLGGITPNRHKSKSRSYLLRLMITAASIVAVCIALIGSGFVSPAMAQALKQIPAIESVFRLAGDLGLRTADEQGLTKDVDERITQDGVTLSISELVFDGARLSFVLTDEGLDGKETTFYEAWSDRTLDENGVPVPKVNVEPNHMEFLINGESVNTGYSLRAAGGHAPNSIIVGALHSAKIKAPDRFDLTVLVKYAKIDNAFEFHIPVETSTERIALTSSTVKTHDNIQFQLDRIELTPVTTRLEVIIKSPGKKDIKDVAEAIPAKYKITGFLNIEFDIVDENGVTPVSLGGSGRGEGDSFVYTSLFEPYQTHPKVLTVKPFIPAKDGKQYIPELEITVPVQ